MSVYLSWLAVVGRPRQTPVGASAGRSKPLSIGRVGWKIGCLGAAVRRLLSIAIYILVGPRQTTRCRVPVDCIFKLKLAKFAKTHRCNECCRESGVE